MKLFKFFILVASYLLTPCFGDLEINTNEYKYRKESAPDKAIELYKSPQKGPGIFKWYKHLEPGFYTLNLDIENGLVRRDFVASIDFNIIGIQTAYFTETGKEYCPKYSYDFNITHGGIHIISIKRFPFFMWPAEEEVMKINKIKIKKRKKPKVWDIYDYHHPGVSYHQLWGWMASSSYQRPKNRKLTREYWDKRIIEEPLKWGSNYIQLYPYYSSKRYLKDGDINKAGAFAHQNGFLIDQHSSLRRNLSRYANESEFLKDYLNQGAQGLFSKLFDRTTTTWMYCSDGFDTEDRHHFITEAPLYGKDNVIKVTNKVWEYFPGSYISECFNLAGVARSHYENILHEGYHGPNYAKVLMCAGSPFSNGHDDFMGIDPFPNNRAFKNEYNWVFRCCQADSRPYTNNKFGGISMIDWITKQCWDFFRPNALALRENRMPIASALNWLGEPSTNLPEVMRKDVYSLSMDPCRAALAYVLAATGRNGLQFWNYPRRRIPEFTDGTGKDALKHWQRRFNEYLIREDYPAHTVRQHNGILAVNHQAMTDNIDLVWDTKNLGEFDNDACKLKLLKNLFMFELDQKSPVILKRRLDAQIHAVNKWPIKLKPGFYNLNFEYNSKLPIKVEIWYCSDYLGTVNLYQNGNESLTFFVSDKFEHNIEFKLVDGFRHSFLNCSITKKHFTVNHIAKLGQPNDSSKEFKKYYTDVSQKVEIRKSVDLTEKNNAVQMPAGLDSQRRSLPTAADLWFDSKAGNYLLCFRAKSQTQPQRIDITLNTHHFSPRDLSFDQPAQKNVKLMSINNWYTEYGLYGKIGAFMLNKKWKTFQIPVVIAHDSQNLRNKIELSVPPGSEMLDFDYITLVKMPIETDIKQTGGHYSELEEKITLTKNGNSVQETRTWKMAADEPSVYLGIKRKNYANLPVKNIIKVKDYEEFNFNGSIINNSGISSQIPEIIRLIDNDKIYPEIILKMQNISSYDLIKWNRETITLYSSKSINQAKPFHCMITLRNIIDDNYPVNGPAVFRWSNEKTEAEFINPYKTKIPLLVRVEKPQKGSYFVKESGWWSVRGAQTVCENKARWDNYIDNYNTWLIDAETGKMPAPPVDYDLVRCLAKPGEKIKLQRYGYINDVVRPGWGSQKQLLFSNITKNKCKVKVTSVSAYLFAPRINFKNKFNSVMLNGKPWSYHDGQNVFLPQQTGNYNVEVYNVNKTIPDPTITSTSAKVKEAVYKNSQLKIKITKPDYVFKIPNDLTYKISVKYDTDKLKIKSVENGKLLRQGPIGAIVECHDNIVIIKFTSE